MAMFFLADLGHVTFEALDDILQLKRQSKLARNNE